MLISCWLSLTALSVFDWSLPVCDIDDWTLFRSRCNDASSLPSEMGAGDELGTLLAPAFCIVDGFLLLSMTFVGVSRGTKMTAIARTATAPAAAGAQTFR